jgi:hypothetical protein
MEKIDNWLPWSMTVNAVNTNILIGVTDEISELIKRLSVASSSF